MYEPAYTYLAMSQITGDDLAKIEQVVVSYEEKIKNLPPDAVVDEADEMEFHKAVLYSTHNPYVIKIGEATLDLFFLILESDIAPLRCVEAAHDHRTIYEALRDKNTAALKKVFDKIIPLWRQRFAKEGDKKTT
jgi:GntR family transcriptional repressor for pyruvate dehydrogenase complex